MKTAWSWKTRAMLWIMETWVYLWVAEHIVPYIRFRMYYTDIRGDRYKQGYQLLQPGDIILAGDKWKLTTLMIGGEWCHAALCVAKGDDVEYEIAEMTHMNYTKSHFYDVCREADEFCILRCTVWDQDYINDILIPTCKSFEHARYDYAFTYGLVTLYCSELVVASDIESRLTVDTSVQSLGREHVSPTNLWESPDVRVIYSSREHKGQFA